MKRKINHCWSSIPPIFF